MRKILIMLTLWSVGCSTVPKAGLDNVGQESVLARMDERSSRPEWLQESEPFRVENGKILSLGVASIPGDHRLEAAYRISDNNGKAAIATAIEQKLEFFFQNAEEGTDMDSTQARYIGAEASQIVANSIRVGKRYWEKVHIVQDNGQPMVRYKVFSLITMPENDFKSAIIDAIRKAQGKGGLSADFSKKVDQHWDKFVNGVEKTQEVAKTGEQ